jgi:hypothetical protein
MKDIGEVIARQNLEHHLEPSVYNADDFAYDKYHPLEEIHAWIDQMVQTYPSLASSFVVGQSYEKRDLKGLKISSNKMAVKLDGTPVNKKKAVWWDGGNRRVRFVHFMHAFLQVSMLENGSVQLRISTSLTPFCRTTPPIPLLPNWSINSIITSYQSSMSMAMLTHGPTVGI